MASLTLDRLLRQRSRCTPDRPAYFFLADGEVEADRATWGELDRRAQRVAAVLRRASSRGDRALLLYPPGLDFIAAFFGCLYAGVVAVPVYPPRPRRDQPRLRAIVADAHPAVALTASSLLAGMEEIAAREPALGELCWLAPEGEGEGEGGELEGDADLDAPAFLQYTSGSTALPKGVAISHANLLHNERMIQEAFRLDEESVVVSWLPLYHDMGLIGTVLQPLHCGGRCVLMPPVAFLQRPRRWLEAVSRYRGTASGGPNFAFELCVRKIPPAEREGLDLASWRVAFNGAEPVRSETLARFAEAFAPCGFDRRALFPCYGLAEATLFVTGGRPGEGAGTTRVVAAALARNEVIPAATGGDGALTLVSSGRPAADLQALIVDPESCVALQEERVGEIWVSGPSVARFYWGNPEASESELRATLADGRGGFLRTGDLGFLRDGELYVTGRRKDLVILRGRNHYPQDLELTAERASLALLPGGAAAFSVDAESEERLVLIAEVDRHALAAHPFATVTAAVREALAAEHEVALADLVLIRQGTLPRTSSGKVQRHACRDLYLNGGLAALARGGVEEPEPVGGTLEVESAAAEAGAEAVLRGALARAVCVDPQRIDPLRAMTSYGLDSLAAVELRNAVEAELGVALPIAELLEGMSLREAARRAVATPEAGRATPSAPTGSAATGEYPLTAGQQALWALYGLDPASAAYHIAGAARLLRTVAPERLDRALRRLGERHPALRTTYANGPDGPLQRIHPQGAVGLRREDAGEASREELLRRVHEAAFQPFDLAAGPVLRVVLFERGEDDPEESVLVLAVHHIAADFWSAAVLVRELGQLCAGAEATSLPALPLAPADLAVRERRLREEGRLDGRLAEARRELAGAPLLSLPCDRPRPALQTFAGGRRGARLVPALAADLRVLARRHDATLFMVLLAGFQALLSRSGGQEDFLVGTPTSGRSSRELEPLVGYLVNPVPVRADLSGDPPAGGLLARARRGALAAMARQDLPFPLLAEGLDIERDPSRPAVFQSMLVFQRAPQPDLAALASFALGEEGGRLETGGLWLEALPLEPHSAQLDLTLLVGGIGTDLAVALQFNRDLFDATTAQRMLGHLARLLAGLTVEDGRRLSELPMLSTAEEHQIFREWNATAVAVQPALLHEWVASQAERTPEAPAVAAGDETLTYRELLARSRRLARHLKSCGAGPETLVAVYLERSCELIVALLATLEAGAAWVPLDPSYPAERLAYMLEDSRAFRVITDRRLGATLPIPAGLLLWMDEPVEEEGAVSEVAGDASAAGPDQLAYVLYTSGSTGRPKGAMNSHRAIVNRLRWMQDAFGLTAADRVLQKTPVSFDVSVWELFWPLMTGACLVMALPGGHLDPPYLRDEIAVSGITTVHFVPSLLQLFLEQPGLEACAGLRRVVVSGETLPRELAVRFQERLGWLGVELHNLYGPTEAAVDVTWWPCPAETESRPVPIGRPIHNTRVVLLDRALSPVPAGVAGELCIGGVQVARGYLRRPDLTAERFIPDPFVVSREEAGARLYRTGDLVRHRAGGELEFLGRIDHQVKVRGVRIELGEVEAALASHPAVREVVAAVAGGEVESARLAAWVVPSGETPSGEELRAHLQSRLPETMIPSAWVFLPRLPLSPSGKVDRRSLPAPDLPGVATSFVAPRTAEEDILAAIWRDVLGCERVGVHDNFFALGGDSILGIQILSRAAQRGLVLTPRQIFRHPTVAELAAVVGRTDGDPWAAAPPTEAAAADFTESGLSERDLQKLMKKLVRAERGAR